MPQKAQADPDQRRKRSAFGLARGVTLIWGAMMLFIMSRGGFNDQLGPILFGVASLMVPLAWWTAIRTARDVSPTRRALVALEALSPELFREWIASHFQELGYSVKPVEEQEKDGVVDLIADKEDETVVVQCSNRAWQPVSEAMLLDLHEAMLEHGAGWAYLATTATLGRGVADWLIGRQMEVWDRDLLIRLSAERPLPGSAPAGDAPRSNAPRKKREGARPSRKR